MDYLEETIKIRVQIPDWVNWMAIDADGSLWGYEVEPKSDSEGWYTPGCTPFRFLCNVTIPENHKLELYTWSY